MTEVVVSVRKSKRVQFSGVAILVAVVVSTETDATNTLNHCLVPGNTCDWAPRYSKNAHVKLFFDSSCVRLFVQLDISDLNTSLETGCRKLHSF